MLHQASQVLLVTGIALSTVSAGIAVGAGPLPAQESKDYSSFFADKDLVGAGGAACPDPITWSVDTRGLKARVARREVRRLEASWSQWSAASGIVVKFAGSERLAFDPSTNGLQSADGSPTPNRHVFVAFKSPSQVPIMTGGAVGLAMPSLVLLPTREIIGGMVILRRGYVLEQRKIDPDRVKHLYMHEFGHVLGLGHGTSQGNVMYPAIDHLGSLGAGDRAGVQAMTQACVRPLGSTVVNITEWRE